MTKKKQYRRYSPEFKKTALKRAAEEDVTDVQVCKELGISARQLRRWRDELRLHGENAFPGKGTSHDEELTRLKRENTKLRRERDFLKEAAALTVLGVSAWSSMRPGLPAAGAKWPN